MNKEIISRIETIIQHLDISVSAFADEIGVQRSSMSHLLNGRNKPSLDFVMKLVNAYPEVDLYWLLKGEGNFPKQENKEPSLNEREISKPLTQENTEVIEERRLSESTKNEAGELEPDKIVMFYSNGTFKTFNIKKD
ncbi:helix-turn-helix transcriptional regulator [Flagellimonas okinawensis]|uniref:Helix-turn-helix transcriptional regulator n=1 Tax=Flagellimonas okinawensis TaxID=3031324 RepID=A0ABT5XII1_9FLAO|nr:helix-turn-helix transcriptional regulator [[Muricauda] okinawensis]MDF0705627.1 helix-turn-helix transcriptional regulator [[Muricauda] okinawensis]